MKRVSFEVAKYIKEVGYPQDINVIDGYDIHGGETVIYSSSKKCEYIAPTYLDVWLWLWREKGIYIKDTYDGAVWVWGDKIKSPIYIEVQTKDPEESIKRAIAYLVENKLLK